MPALQIRSGPSSAFVIRLSRFRGGSHIPACAERTSWSKTEAPGAGRHEVPARTGLPTAEEAMTSTDRLPLLPKKPNRRPALRQRDPGRAGWRLASRIGRQEPGTK